MSHVQQRTWRCGRGSIDPQTSCGQSAHRALPVLDLPIRLARAFSKASCAGPTQCRLGRIRSNAVANGAHSSEPTGQPSAVEIKSSARGSDKPLAARTHSKAATRISELPAWGERLEREGGPSRGRTVWSTDEGDSRSSAAKRRVAPLTHRAADPPNLSSDGVGGAIRFAQSSPSLHRVHKAPGSMQGNE
jgi:hypothetical protein